MIRLMVTLIFAGLLMVSAERASAQGKRVALVVGISSYSSAPKLPNAGNDANAMADLFRKAGFDVVTARSDVSNLEFKRTIRDFEDAVADADIAVVFYAGHGIQVRETNYLIPSDAKLLNERDIEDEAISLDRLITAVEGAKRLRLIILDACRDNPFPNKMQRRVASRAAPTPGLGKVEPSVSDTLIAYAAKDGSVANDGDGSHSPYTTALLKNLTVPGLDIRLAFGRVRDDVLRATNRKQEPYVYGSLGGGTVALVPAPVEAAPAASAVQSGRSGPDGVRTDYELVERVGKREAWEVFLNTHKTGMYADLARVQLAKLVDADRTNLGDADRTVGSPRVNTPPRTEGSGPLPPIDTAPKPTAQEQRAWDRVKSSTNHAAIRKFLEQFPSSPLAAAAQERLDMLDRQAREREETLKAEREAAAQRDAEARAQAAEAAARQRAEEERAKALKAAAKQREAEERARTAEAERQKAEELAATRQREAEERARAAELLARQQAEDRARAAEALARQREAEAQLKAAEADRRKAASEPASRPQADEERARAAETLARQREAEARLKAAEADRRRAEAEAAAKQQQAEESRKTAEKLKTQREVEERAQAVARKREADERAKAERATAARREAEERMKSAEADRQRAEAQAVANRRRTQEAEARKAAAAAERRQRAAAEERAPRPVVQVARPVAAAAPVAAPAARSGAATMVGVGF